MSAKSHVNTGVGKIFLSLGNEGLFEWLMDRDYGGSDFKVFAVLNCLPPITNPKKSVRFSRADNTLHLDVMLDFVEMSNADEIQRRDNVTCAMLQQIPDALRKYPKLEFDTNAFSEDLHFWFEDHLWLRNPS